MTEILQQLLSQPLTDDLIDQIDPDHAKQYKKKGAPTGADLLARKILALALDQTRPNSWAVQVIYERLEGKPAPGAAPKDEGRHIEDKLDEITTANLNAIAGPLTKVNRRKRKSGSTEDPAGGHESEEVDLPDHETGGPEKPVQKPTMETGSPGEGKG